MRDRVRIGFSVLLLALTAGACIAATSGNIGTPVFHYDAEAASLGTLGRQVRKEFDVPVTNRGGRPLLIHSIRTTCGCFSQAERQKEIEITPGETRVFHFTLTTSPSMRGRNTKRLYFDTNDPEGLHSIPVTFRVRVPFRIAVLPDKVDLGRFSADDGARIRRTVKLISPYPRPLRVASVESSSPFVLCKGLGAGKRPYIQRVAVEILPELPAGRLSTRLKVTTNEGEVVIPVVGAKESEVGADPETLVFPPAAVGETVMAQLRLWSNDGERFRVLETESSSSSIAVRGPNPSQPAASHSLVVEFSPAPRMEEGCGRALLTVRTHAGKALKVPCRFIVKD